MFHFLNFQIFQLFDFSIIQYFNLISLRFSSFNLSRYQWTAANAGTHYWHTHTGLQKFDGLFGSIVVRQTPSKDPNSNLYDDDLPIHVILISDWLHEYATEIFPGRLVVKPGQTPDNVLINGKGQFTVRSIIIVVIIIVIKIGDFLTIFLIFRILTPESKPIVLWKYSRWLQDVDIVFVSSIHSQVCVRLKLISRDMDWPW